ncbi:MAG: C40 family peptidase [Sheuella sp.]|jgi:cell wall-associated NlpC family hydrolase|nr:C40 family peptidase [Sheuella sp.]
MIQFSSSIARISQHGRALRRATWISALSAISLLSGCAGVDGQKNAGYGLGGYSAASADWRSSNDPIGAFLARSKSGNGLYYGDISHPLAAHMMTQLGVRYRSGGKSPDTGFDCSGLVFYSANQSLGLKLPPRADDMARQGSQVNIKELTVGDLVFFNTMGRKYSHVGVYIGQDQFVHSPASGGVVRVENMNDRYWAKRYTGARRLDLTEVASK